MKRLGVIVILLMSCLNIAACTNMSGDKTKIESPMIVSAFPTSTTSEPSINMGTDNMKIESPMLVSVFPTGTTRESYLIILSEDGTIETFAGMRKDAQINESEYSNNAADWFDKVETREKGKLGSKEITIINDLLKEISFSEIQSERRIVRDSWERMLFIDSKPYYKYGIEEEDSLARLINKIIEYSPIKVDMHGWA